MKETIGIDFGVSAVKIIRTDGEEIVAASRIDSAVFSSNDLADLITPQVSHIASTGIRADRLSGYFHGIPIVQIDEFTSGAMGALRLSGLKHVIVTSIGTGTSFVGASSNGNIKHLGGSGIGGGTLIGLCESIAGCTDIPKLAKMAEIGDLQKVDLCIRDVTDHDIIGLPPYTTVANFAGRGENASVNDLVKAVFNMVVQTIGMLSVFAARIWETEDIVLIGSPAELPIVKQLISMVEMLHGVQFHIPVNAAFAAAYGAANACNHRIIQETKGEE